MKCLDFDYIIYIKKEEEKLKSVFVKKVKQSLSSFGAYINYKSLPDWVKFSPNQANKIKYFGKFNYKTIITNLTCRTNTSKLTRLGYFFKH